MRHFRDEQRSLGRRVYYSELDDPANRGNFGDEIRRWDKALQPERLIVLEPGDWRVREQMRALDMNVEFRADRHFLCSKESFGEFAEDHPRLVLEPFYRFMRLRLGILLDPDGKPTGGAWNYDKQNRKSFPAHWVAVHSAGKIFRTGPGHSRRHGNGRARIRRKPRTN